MDKEERLILKQIPTRREKREARRQRNTLKAHKRDMWMREMRERNGVI